MFFHNWKIIDILKEITQSTKKNTVQSKFMITDDLFSKIFMVSLIFFVWSCEHAKNHHFVLCLTLHVPKQCN